MRVPCRCCAALLAAGFGSHPSVASQLIDPLGSSSVPPRRDGNSCTSTGEKEARSAAASAAKAAVAAKVAAVASAPSSPQRRAQQVQLDGNIKQVDLSRQVESAGSTVATKKGGGTGSSAVV